MAVCEIKNNSASYLSHYTYVREGSALLSHYIAHFQLGGIPPLNVRLAPNRPLVLRGCAHYNLLASRERGLSCLAAENKQDL